MINASRRDRRKNRIDNFSYIMGELKLDVGSGGPLYNAKHHGQGDDYVGIDIMDCGQAMVWDIENGIPLPDNSCVNIFCSHVVEHIEDIIGLMNEFWRILKPEGEIYIICPHKDNEHAYLVHHLRRFDKKTFEAFDFSWSPVGEWKKEYDILPWSIKELIVNSKKDIHLKATPKKP